MDITGKVAVVTGSASGIGRGIARSLAGRGASILLADVDEEGGRAGVEEIAGGGGTAAFVRTDVTRAEDLAAMLDAAGEHFGGFDILVNNAGIVCGEPLWPRTDPAVLARQVAVNLTAVIVGTRLAVEPLQARGGGVVVNTASIGALLPLEEEPGYSATKAGVLMFTRACAGLARTHGVRVNTVLPGLVDTPLLAKSGDGTREASWASQAREFMPLLSTDDVADVVIDLIEDDTQAGAHRIVGELPDFVTALL
ncbi:MAG TPA: SDR family oxidoreductase [Acidimicrobiales bacterium]|nr:SDR family oxidoreductase [Acidimicrobiales bacterium]